MRWDEAFDRREEFIKEKEREAKAAEILISLEAVKEYYENLIENYDSYTAEQNGINSFEELQAKLQAVKRQIQQTLV
jgi:hypothetical protein